MYAKFYLFIVLFRILATCLPANAQSIFNKNGKTIATRISTPRGFTRIDVEKNSFAAYLQNLPLKAVGDLVKFYNGTIKTNNNVYCAVVDMDIDKVNLQQCADAVMRLRAEYLYQQNRFDDIHFNFISDGKPRYFTTYAKDDFSYNSFRKFMRYIFSYANTRSLRNELQPISFSEMNIGDILIQSGNPYGHAVIVVDMCENPTTGEKLYMLAQSYMPAQETQILINQHDSIVNPWYHLETDNEFIETPEWQFTYNDLHRF